MEQTQSENIADLVEALRTVQMNLKGAIKDATNPFFNSNYADLESVWECCRGPLADNGLCVIQTNGGTAESPSVITTLAHVSGQWIRGELFLTPDKKGPQGIGSCITYGRRYGLAGIVGIIQVDDDAEGATSRNKKTTTKKTPKEDDIPMGDMPNSKLISDAQRKRLYAISKEFAWGETAVKSLLAKYGFESSTEITKAKYKDICEELEHGMEG
jgi:hypothetical protein